MSKTITITAVAPIKGAQESSTYWPANRSNAVRDLSLSSALPQFQPEHISVADPAMICRLINDSFSDVIRGIKCQRLTPGASLSLIVPDDPMGQSIYVLSMATESSRQKSQWTSAIFAELKKDSLYTSAVTSYCARVGLNLEKAWKGRIEGEYLMGSLRKDWIKSMDTERNARAQRHIQIVAEMLPEGNPGRLGLLAAIEIIKNATTDDGLGDI